MIKMSTKTIEVTNELKAEAVMEMFIDVHGKVSENIAVGLYKETGFVIEVDDKPQFMYMVLESEEMARDLARAAVLAKINQIKPTVLEPLIGEPAEEIELMQMMLPQELFGIMAIVKMEDNVGKPAVRAWIDQIIEEDGRGAFISIDGTEVQANIEQTDNGATTTLYIYKVRDFNKLEQE